MRRAMIARRRAPLAIAALVTAAFLCAPSPLLAAPWYEHYAWAERALAAEDWARAVEELNQAIGRKADSGARERTYGMRVVAYFPYLKLGVAFTHMGRYEAALQAFDTEERLGAVQQSEAALAELERFRERAAEGLGATAHAVEDRIAAIVERGLRESAVLERDDRLPEALEALGRVLAVAPDHAEGLKRAARLRQAIQARERAREDAERSAALLAQGREALNRRRWAAAASLLREALTLEPSAETEALLRQAEQGLRESVSPSRPPRATPQELAAARRLAEGGRFSEALERLQQVLAGEPESPDALALQAEWLRARRRAERAESVGRAVTEAEAELAAGRVERALAAANRALAQDAGAPAALAVVQRAYAELGRRLLGSPGAENIPPAVRFVDLREETAGGSRAQMVRIPDFRLDGVVLDRTEVAVLFLNETGAELPGVLRSQSVGDLVLTEFSLQQRLRPGSAIFRVRAENTAGLSSLAEYQVIYRRPLTRSPWLFGVLALVGCALAGAVRGLGAWRRSRLRRRRFNPFVAGAPVVDERLFFGRERLIQRVLQTIHNNSLLLYGERRIGKTSLLHQLKRRLSQLDDPEFTFFPVFVDLQGIPEERFFATLGAEIADELAPLLPPDALAPPESRESRYDHREFVADLRRVLAVLARLTPKRAKLVLLLDEVDELNGYDPRVNQRLRSLFMRGFSEHLVAVVAGVEIRKQWDQHGSPWYNFFEEIEVTAIDCGAAAALIRTPLRGVFSVTDAAVAAILQASECKPYRVQKLCVALVDRLHQEGRTEVTRVDVEALAKDTRP